MTTQELADRIEIRELCARYCRAMDDGDAGTWASLFTDEGMMEGSTGITEGREALEALVHRATGSAIHTTTDSVVEFDGDSARHWCTVVVYNRTADRGGNDVRLVGRYEDELRRTPEGWRFQRRSVATPYRLPQPVE
jgi:ketosteroid isomerase-like protein